GVDFVTISPVAATASHPGAETLGWDGFGRLCEHAPVPVYALGGMTPHDLGRSRALGGFGVAGIRQIAAS
ncbi:thiamine phosphate synthase, partial [Klebsiella pneumoniae]|uniref:thiamine phosphate synthase n=1 Tax=Klebsiella pneumoniae TaxID=573 RepID=UPI00272F0A89